MRKFLRNCTKEKELPSLKAATLFNHNPDIVLLVPLEYDSYSFNNAGWRTGEDAKRDNPHPDESDW